MCLLKEALWVHGLTIDDGFKVEMWTGYVAGCADVSNDLTLGDGIANRDMVRAEMRITGDETTWVLNVYTVPRGREPGSTNDFTALCCVNRITNGTRNVET